MNCEDDPKFWLRMVGLLTAIALISIGSCTCVVNYQDNSAIVRMVERGASPIAAHCAIRQSEPGACSIIAAQEKP